MVRFAGRKELAVQGFRVRKGEAGQQRRKERANLFTDRLRVICRQCEQEKELFRGPGVKQLAFKG